MDCSMVKCLINGNSGEFYIIVTWSKGVYLGERHIKARLLATNSLGFEKSSIIKGRGTTAEDVKPPLSYDGFSCWRY